MTIGDRPWVIVSWMGTSNVSALSSKSAGLYFTPVLNGDGVCILGLSIFMTALQAMFINVPNTKMPITKLMTMMKCLSRVTWPWLWLLAETRNGSSQTICSFRWTTYVSNRSLGSLHLKNPNRYLKIMHLCLWVAKNIN